MSRPTTHAPLLAVELDGGAVPPAWVAAAQGLERAGVHLLTIPDALAPRRGEAGRAHLGADELDAVQVAAFLSTQTSTVGLLPSVNVTESEPFHVSTASATLDYTSTGRAGLTIRVGTAEEAQNIGLRVRNSDGLGADEDNEVAASLWSEAGDAVTVIRRLWDSWEDDAIIRDVPTGRFIDRERLHYVDFVGKHFSVKGPAITPRPPQGQVPIAVEASDESVAAWAAAHADIVFIPETGFERIADAANAARTPDQAPLLTLVDLEISEQFIRDLNHNAPLPEAWESRLRELLAGRADGLRLRPEAGNAASESLAGVLIPKLQAIGLLADADGAGATEGTTTLRSTLGLQRPASQYASNVKKDSE